jgi:hypothetical protein
VDTDIPLMRWSTELNRSLSPYYDSALLWAAYLHHRLGSDFISQVAASSDIGFSGIDAALQNTDQPGGQLGKISARSLFMDWATANYLVG